MSCGIRETSRLALWKYYRRRDRCDKTSTIPLVITHPVDVQVVGGRVCTDFKRYRVSMVHADVCGEPLDGHIRVVTRQLPRNSPYAFRCAWLRIFADDVVGHRRSATESLCLNLRRKNCRCRIPEQEKQEGSHAISQHSFASSCQKRVNTAG